MEPYTIVPFPLMRRLVRDLGWLVQDRYTMRGFLEIDVTYPRALLREYKAMTGDSLSFTAFLIKCVAEAVNNHKSIQAMLNWRGNLVIFEDVDIGTLIEREVDGQRFPLAHTIRAANKKSFLEIHNEVRQVQAEPLSDKEAGMLKNLVKMPKFIRRWLLWIVSKIPKLRKDFMGTVSLSAVGMFGSKNGWGMVTNVHSLSLIVGSITKKPGIVNDRIEIREYLNLTVEFDHEIVDGAPAARFTKELVDLIESGFSLNRMQFPDMDTEIETGV